MEELKTTAQGKLTPEDLWAVYKTTKHSIIDYVNSIERYNRYRTARADLNYGIMDDRSKLIDIYENILLNGHLQAVIQTLKSQCLGERVMLAREAPNGQFIRDVDASRKVEGRSFAKIIEEILNCKLYGYSLIELRGIDEFTGKLNMPKSVERRNILPLQNYVLKRAGQFLPGWNLNDKALQDDYIWVDNGDLGLLASAAPMVLAMKAVYSAFVTYSQSYGYPIIQGKSNDETTTGRQQLANSIANASRERVIVTGIDEELDIHALNSSNSEQIYTKAIDLAKSEINNLIVGSSSVAGDSESYLGSAQSHQDLFRDRVLVYRTFIEDVINEQVMPRLRNMGFIDDETLVFKYSSNLEMSVDSRINLFDKLSDKFEITSEEIFKNFGVVVGDQINTERWSKNEASPELDSKKESSPEEVEAKVNFLTGKKR